MASRPDGTSTVYELNLSYLDALCTPEEAADPATLAAKALAAHSILFAFLGVPGDLLPLARRLAARPRGHGGQPDQPAHQPRGPRRRPAGGRAGATTRAAARSSPACGTCSTYAAQHEAFSPFGTQHVERLDDRVFAVRRAAGTPGELLCVTNVTGEHGHAARGDRPRRAHRPGRRTADAGPVGLRLGAALLRLPGRHTNRGVYGSIRMTLSGRHRGDRSEWSPPSPRSSAGQSSGLLIRRSQVRILSGAPEFSKVRPHFRLSGTEGLATPETRCGTHLCHNGGGRRSIRRSSAPRAPVRRPSLGRFAAI